MTERPALPRLGIVVTGHVDHGKSTVVGRLLADAGAVPRGKIDQVRAMCERTARPFEYAFLLDALRDERSQGITIDSARIFFHSRVREYALIDAPGHVEFLKNMVSGASRADAALLVVDAQAGVQENSRRHGALLSLLGITQVVVVVNKMDLVSRREDAFAAVRAELASFLPQVGLSPSGFIPVSGREGDNLTERSDAMPWYDGPSVLQALDAFKLPPPPEDAPFRLWVQDVYKFTETGDDRRIVAGTVESGRVVPGDEVVFYPSGKRATVATLEAFNAPPPQSASAGQAAGFTLSQQVYVQRGELATLAGQAEPKVTSRVQASVFWLGKRPLSKNSRCVLKLGTSRVPMQLESVQRVADADDGAPPRQEVHRHELAECTFRLERALAFDTGAALPNTARYVIVEDTEIQGGGVLREALADEQDWVRGKVRLRNRKWEQSAVPLQARIDRLGQVPALLVITGPRALDRKSLARAVELRLFEAGRAAYFLGIGNLLYGVDADLPREPSHRLEHLRRLAEVANLMLDAGLLLVVTAADLTRDEVALIRTGVERHRVEVAWLGDAYTTDLRCPLVLPSGAALEENVDQLAQQLMAQGAPPRLASPRPAVLWFTGLSGAGKSTIARGVARALLSRGHRVEVLDGDTLREAMPAIGFTRPERDAHVRRVGFLASRLQANGVFVVAALVSPYAAARGAVRALCDNFIEIHVATPLAECERRDTKGLYARARAGTVQHFTGINDPYEPPPAAEVTLDTTHQTVAQSIQQVLAKLGPLPRGAGP